MVQALTFVRKCCLLVDVLHMAVTTAIVTGLASNSCIMLEIDMTGSEK